MVKLKTKTLVSAPPVTKRRGIVLLTTYTRKSESDSLKCLSRMKRSAQDAVDRLIWNLIYTIRREGMATQMRGHVLWIYRSSLMYVSSLPLTGSATATSKLILNLQKRGVGRYQDYKISKALLNEKILKKSTLRIKHPKALRNHLIISNSKTHFYEQHN